VHGRTCFDCGSCGLVFVAPWQRPGPAEERAHYGTHRNHPDDPGYRRFLARLAEPLALRLEPEAEGLDYGCGPGPALPAMLRERGFRVAQYDPYFASDPVVLRRTYDFLTCTEVAEHFHEPAVEFDRLRSLLRPGGWLGLMTEVLKEETRLEGWRYARDPTHVCFYRARTLEWIARGFGWAIERPDPDVALFRAPVAARES
jgi:hypothetical protein